MDQMNILHISDLHCKPTPESRDGGFTWRSGAPIKRYVDSMHSAFAEANIEKDGNADLIAVTGDFVHQFSDAFSQADEFIDEVCKAFSCHDVVVCPGNHDYCRDWEAKGVPERAREKYRSFAGKLHNQILQRNNNYKHTEEFRKRVGPGFGAAELIVPEDGSADVAVLSLDTTWHDFDIDNVDSRSEFLHLPGHWHHADDERNDMFSQIANYIEDELGDKTLVVLTHYPVQTEAYQARDPDFERQHRATAILGFFGTLSGIKRRKPVVALCGDIHESDICKIRLGGQQPSYEMFQCVTGRCYLPLDEIPSNPWKASARMVVVQEGNRKHDVESVALEFVCRGEFDPTNGRWKYSEKSQALPAKRRSSAGKRRVTHAAKPERRKPKPDLVTDQAPVLLRDVIAEEGLIQLRRVDSGENYERLMNIQVGPLMNDPDVRSATIRFFASSLARKRSQQFLVGIDCWGSALAAQLGLYLGCPSCGVSVRGFTKSELKSEIARCSALNSEPFSESASVCLVTDVIATGETVGRLYDELRNTTHLKKKQNYTVFSMIRSAHAKGKGKMRDLQSVSVLDGFHNTVVRKTRLPTELPPNVMGLR